MAFAPLSMSMACSTSPHPGSAPGDCPTGLECPTVAVTQIASDRNVSAELAVTSGTLYWVDRGWAITDSILAVPVGGGAPTTFYAAPDTNAAIEAIAVDAHDVYWTEVEASPSGAGYVSTLKAMPLGYGGAPMVLASTASPSVAFFSVAVDGTYAYYCVENTELFGSGGGLERVPLAGGPAEVVVATDLEIESVYEVTADVSGVYWLQQSSDGSNLTQSLMRLAPGAGQPSTLVSVSFNLEADLASNTSPVIPEGPIAVHGDTVVWIGSDGSVSSVPITGGSPRLLLSGGAEAVFLAAGASDAYVIESGPKASGVMQRVPLDGSPATTIASGMGVAGGWSAYQGIVADATSLYWAGVGGVFSAPQ
jgi:hypothetical protein